MIISSSCSFSVPRLGFGVVATPARRVDSDTLAIWQEIGQMRATLHTAFVPTCSEIVGPTESSATETSKLCGRIRSDAIEDAATAVPLA